MYAYILSYEKCVKNCGAGVKILWRKEACAIWVSILHTMVHLLNILHIHWYTYYTYKYYYYIQYTTTHITLVHMLHWYKNYYSNTEHIAQCISANTYINEWSHSLFKISVKDYNLCSLSPGNSCLPICW